MPPIHEYGNWNLRSADTLEEIEPLRKFVFICEGSKTEDYYFKELINHRKTLGLHPLVDIRLWEKTDGDEGISDPLALVRFAQRMKGDLSLGFDRTLDRMVIVFDLDVYSRVGEGRTGASERAAVFDQVRGELDDADVLAVTNPSFELFLMLHREGAFKDVVLPHARELLENRKVGQRRFAQVLFTETYGMNPKSNPKIGSLVGNVLTAIEEERNLNRCMDACLTTLTSTVGKIIETIKDDPFRLP